MQQFKVEQNQAGQRLDKFLHKYLPNAGTSFLYKMLRKKNITLNGKKAEGKEILTLGDEIRCFFSDETFAKFADVNIASLSEADADAGSKETILQKSVNISEYEAAYKAFLSTKKSQTHMSVSLEPIEILYEDSDVLIVNKPAGILTQKAQPSDISLNEWLIGYLLHTKKITAQDLALFKPSVCNRLDRNTSGIVLCGVSLKGSQVLSKMIHDRNIHKYYRTICKGMLTESGMLNGSLAKNKKTNTVTVSIEGSEIKTAYEPIKTLQHNLTYLEVELITGKTHQIRAHLASIGHPLMGDKKYGNKSLNQKAEKTYQLKHQLLHAYRIEFPKLSDDNNALSEKVVIAPLPKNFERILEDLS